MTEKRNTDLDWLLGPVGTGSARRRGLVLFGVGIVLLAAFLAFAMITNPTIGAETPGFHLGSGGSTNPLGIPAAFGLLAAYMGLWIGLLGDRSRRMLRDLFGNLGRAGPLAWVCLAGLVVVVGLGVVFVAGQR